MIGNGPYKKGMEMILTFETWAQSEKEELLLYYLNLSTDRQADPMIAGQIYVEVKNEIQNTVVKYTAGVNTAPYWL